MTLQTSAMKALQDNWQKLEQHSESLMVLLHNEAWEQAAEHAKQRYYLITRHFTLFPVNDETADFYQAKLPRLQAQDETMRSLAKDSKHTLQQQLRLISNGKTAVKAYQHTSQH